MPKKSTERKVRRKSLKVKRKSRRKPKKAKSKSRRKSKKIRRKSRRKSKKAKSKSRRKSKKIRRKSKRKSSKAKSKSRRKVKRQIKRKVKGKSPYSEKMDIDNDYIKPTTRYGGERTLVERCFQAKSGGGSGYKDLSKIDHIPIVYNIKWERIEFKIMFWNIQGTSSSEGIWYRDKMQCVIDIVHGHNPDLVFFSEVSYLLEENFLHGYRLLEQSKEFTKHGGQGTKDLRMYARLGSPFTYAREKRSGDVRSLLRAKFQHPHSGKWLEIFGLHAKASTRGGKFMLNQFINILNSSPHSCIFGGDFNLDLNPNYNWSEYLSYKETFTPEKFVYLASDPKRKGKIIRPITSPGLFYGGTQQSGKILDYILVSYDIEAEALAPW